MKKLQTLVKIIIPIFVMFICTNVNATTITIDATKPGTTDPDSYYVTNTATLTITGSYDYMTAYKIMATYYNRDTNIITYEFTTEFKAFLNQSSTYKDLTVEEYYQLTSGDVTSGSIQTESTLDKLASIYTEYIRKNSIVGIEMSREYWSTKTTTLVTGSYLIIPEEVKSNDSYIYAVMVGNLDFEANGTEWILNDASIVAKKTNYGSRLSICNSRVQDKTLTIGKEYQYIIEIYGAQYPTNALNKTIIVKNIMDEGITFIGLDTITMNIGENIYEADETGIIKDIDGNVIAITSFASQELIINIDTGHIYNDFITIEYNAKLNENANIGTANYNKQETIFSIDPYGNTEEIENDYDNETVAYTYDLVILKYDVDAESKLLNGAVFEIYTDEDLTDLVGTVTTGTKEDGLGLFHGLAQGTYYIVEKKAPSGYKLIRDVIVYELDAGMYEGIPRPTSLEDELPEGTFLLEIPNEKISFLPVTGGIGTLIYTLIGLITAGLSLYYIKIYKKKQENI